MIMYKEIGSYFGRFNKIVVEVFKDSFKFLILILFVDMFI